MARFGEFRACRANFVTLWPPKTRAGRTLYRIQGGCGASRHNRTPSAAGVKGAGGSGGPGCGARGRRLCLAWLRDTSCRRCGGRRIAWSRCRWVAAGPGRASRSTTPSRRLACGDLAGGPPPTGNKAARPWPQVARRPYGALHKGDACSVRCRGPCMPANSADAQTRPRPVSRPRPRQ